ncbi:GTPase regulator Nrf1 [Coemansia sp. RSA 1939]|nr:GTPase regulator Nrf1 [Coemansia sp. RSA 1939]KAJ2608911.1 GTPase regulator Nrf1 [Coemansia sp. RSA 1804]KAJ2675204.1 GTPase regulator Nrf1 [Coemansia sp. RSA 1285]
MAQTSDTTTNAKEVDFKLLRPKNYFANERTFVNWLQLAVTMGGLGLALLNFGGSGIRVRISAFIFETGALALIVYAYATFWRRAQRLRRGDRGTWDDRFVPVVVVIFFIFATAINFGLTFHKKEYIPPLNSLMATTMSWGRIQWRS